MPGILVENCTELCRDRCRILIRLRQRCFYKLCTDGGMLEMISRSIVRLNYIFKTISVNDQITEKCSVNI